MIVKSQQNGIELVTRPDTNPDWFHGKDVLDIGCNVGHMTLAVGKTFQPRSILGVDIDDSLIKMARKNVKHYSSCIMPTSQQNQSGWVTPGMTPSHNPTMTPSQQVAQPPTTSSVF